jgi:uncharacterized protein (TIGR02246 family)
MRRTLLLALCPILILLLPFPRAHAQAAGRADPQAEERRIRERVREWLAAVQKKDAKAVAEFYASDGSLLAPNAPAAEGREAITQAWRGMMGLPGFSLTFETRRVDVAEAGDMACELGSYSLAFDNPKGGDAIRDHGKYVVVWRKKDGRWEVKADIFNSDVPAGG